MVRCDTLSVDEIAALDPSHIVISPGPCTPNEAGVSVPLVRRLGPPIPILGVCLGHQCIGQAFGGQIVRARRPMHGKASRIAHDGHGALRRAPGPARRPPATTPWWSSRRDLPGELVVTARSEEGEIMALRHREHPIVGLQFHPESVLTEHGRDLLRAFLGQSSSGRT